MENSTDVRELARKVEDLEEAMSNLKTQMSQLQEGVQKAVGNLLPKVESLLLQQNFSNSTSGNEASGGTSVAAFGEFAGATAFEGAPPPTSLLDAAERDDAVALYKLLSAGADIHQRDRYGDTALHIAAIHGHLEALDILLESREMLEVRGQCLRTPLHCAAAHGRLEATRRLLKSGAHVTSKDVNGFTPIFLAAQEGHKEIVALLLPREASTDAIANKETLMVHGAKAGQWVVVKFLLEKGASATTCKTPDESALALAAKAGKDDIVRELLRRGAASDNAQVKSALEAAKTAAVVWAIVEAARGAVKGNAGRFGLLFAACEGRTETLVALLQAGLDANVRDDSNQTVLHVAAGNGRVACINELLKHGAAVDAVEQVGQTALHHASRFGDTDSVRALLEAGASAAKVDKRGNRPIDLTNSEDVRQALRSAQ